MPKATGWTKEWPANTDIKDAYYFARRDSSKDVAVVGFAAGMMWLNGVCYQSSQVAPDLRFLGPLKPEDFEQLAALRKAAELTIKVLDDADYGLDVIAERVAFEHFEQGWTLTELADAIEKALIDLAQQGEKS